MVPLHEYVAAENFRHSLVQLITAVLIVTVSGSVSIQALSQAAKHSLWEQTVQKQSMHGSEAVEARVPVCPPTIEHIFG